MTKGGCCFFPLSSDVTVGSSHPWLASPPPPLPLGGPCLYVFFPLCVFLFPNHMAPLVAAAPPTFLACRGNKSRKCYRKGFTRHGVTFLAMSCNRVLSLLSDRYCTPSDESLFRLVSVTDSITLTYRSRSNCFEEIESSSSSNLCVYTIKL